MALTRNSLLFKAKSGDEASWKHLADLYRPFLVGWLRHHEVPPQDVDDLTQEILLSVVKSLPAYEHNGNQGAFRAWLRTIVLKRVIDYRRSRRSRVRFASKEAGLALEELVSPHQSELELVWEREHDHYVVLCLLELVRHQFEPITFQAFRRQAFDGIRPSQVAEELGLSVKAVYAAKSRVMRLVRERAAGLIN